MSTKELLGEEGDAISAMEEDEPDITVHRVV